MTRADQQFIRDMRELHNQLVRARNRAWLAHNTRRLLNRRPDIAGLPLPGLWLGASLLESV